MKASDRAVLIMLAVVGLVGAFWFTVLSPKRDEAAQLQDDVERLEKSVSQAEQQIALAGEVREGFPSDYRKLVTLGKAVPEDDDTASLFAQLSGVAERAEVDFRSVKLSEDVAESAAPAPAPPAGDEGATPAGEGEPAGESSTSATPAAATESAAATLPIGATVGPAGLPVMPYDLQFRGDFFNLADLFQGLDGLVSMKRGPSDDLADARAIRGRLMTIDGFSLSRDADRGFPFLIADVAVTTYITPAEQDLTGGASPTGPAPASEPGATPVSSTGTAP